MIKKCFRILFVAAALFTTLFLTLQTSVRAEESPAEECIRSRNYRVSTEACYNPLIGELWVNFEEKVGNKETISSSVKLIEQFPYLDVVPYTMTIDCYGTCVQWRNTVVTVSLQLDMRQDEINVSAVPTATQTVFRTSLITTSEPISLEIEILMSSPQLGRFRVYQVAEPDQLLMCGTTPDGLRRYWLEWEPANRYGEIYHYNGCPYLEENESLAYELYLTDSDSVPDGFNHDKYTFGWNSPVIPATTTTTIAVFAIRSDLTAGSPDKIAERFTFFPIYPHTKPMQRGLHMLYESQQVVMYQTPFAGSDERHWVMCGAEEEVWDEVPPSFNGLASIALADFEAANLKPTSACVTADEAGERRPLQ